MSASHKKTERLVTIPEWFHQQGYKCANDVMEYLANQYYVYGEERSLFVGGWTAALRTAVRQDSLHFEQYYEDEGMKSFYERRGRSPWHHTDRVLGRIFDDISEITAYQVDERDTLREEFLQAIYESWCRAKKRHFKNKLNGNGEYNW